MFIGMCVNGMQAKYKVHIENHVIDNFANVMVKVKKAGITVPSINQEVVKENLHEEFGVGIFLFL